MPYRMNRRAVLVGGVGTIALACLAGSVNAADDPVAFAKSLYALENLWSDATADDDAMAKYLDPRLAALVAANYAKEDFESALDYDPLVQAQDYDRIRPVFKVDSKTAREATIRSTFKNFDEMTTVFLDLVLTPKGWRLADIRTTDGASLVKELIELNAKK